MDAQQTGIWRQRALEMKNQAERAQTAELRASYLAMAEDWAHLAESDDAAAREN